MNSVLLKFQQYSIYCLSGCSTNSCHVFISTIWHQLSCSLGHFFLKAQGGLGCLNLCFVCAERGRAAQQPAGHAFRASASAKHGEWPLRQFPANHWRTDTKIVGTLAGTFTKRLQKLQRQMVVCWRWVAFKGVQRSTQRRGGGGQRGRGGSHHHPPL